MTIRRVSVVSTGTVQIRPEHARFSGRPLLWWLLTSRRWSSPRPINVYVIEHERGLVLFDTGQDRRSVTSPRYFPGGLFGFLFRRLARFDIDPSETLTEQLGALGHRPDEVVTTVLSHLHQDHIGGLVELTRSDIVVSTAEWAELRRPLAVSRGLLVDHIDLPGLRVTPITPRPTADASLAPFTAAHDLFGDGSLMLLPTPGHTVGSLSLLVRRAGAPPLLLVGDLTYDVQSLSDGVVPGVGEHRQLVETTRRVNLLRQRMPDLVILAAHDPAARGLLEAATAEPSTR